MIKSTDTLEKALQKLIVMNLVGVHGYLESISNDFDREFYINKAQ